MATVLVVDDSSVDRRLVGGLLQKDADLEVQYAIHGADALEKIIQSVPDLVVTDLIMPEMDGLTLVATVKHRFRHLPVILMTSKGSEELAVQALEQGAASYVPKAILAQRLLDTVRNILSVSSRQRSHLRLMGCMTSSHATFELINDPALFAPLVSYIQEECIHLRICDESDRTRLGVALEEALANALYHGNLEIGSELRETNEVAYWKLVRERTQSMPYCERRIHVDADISREQATFTIRDDGKGFDPTSLPDPTDPANLEKVSGRGVLLMRTFMDDVRYNPSGNIVTLVKRRDPNAPAGENGD
ncbi:MAG: ATP-binding protein [Thermoguttaceae bacterium]|nr:ATP-binding protein [Thermoguttaceae bacterium]